MSRTPTLEAGLLSKGGNGPTRYVGTVNPQSEQLTPEDCKKDATVLFFTRLIPLASVLAFATTVNLSDAEQVATAGLMLGSVLVPLFHAASSQFCPSPCWLDKKQLIETIGSLQMCAGVALMGKGFIQGSYPSKFEEVETFAAGGLFAVFALLSATYNILKLAGCIDNETGKPSVEAAMSCFGLVGSVFFLVKQILDYRDASKSNEQDKMDFCKKFMVVAGGFTLSTLYLLRVAVKKLCAKAPTESAEAKAQVTEAHAAEPNTRGLVTVVVPDNKDDQDDKASLDTRSLNTMSRGASSSRPCATRAVIDVDSDNDNVSESSTHSSGSLPHSSLTRAFLPPSAKPATEQEETDSRNSFRL